MCDWVVERRRDTGAVPPGSFLPSKGQHHRQHRVRRLGHLFALDGRGWIHVLGTGDRALPDEGAVPDPPIDGDGSMPLAWSRESRLYRWARAITAGPRNSGSFATTGHAA